MSKITTNQHDFLTELASYISDNCNGYDWKFEDIINMMKLVEVYHEASPAFIAYVTQFNYENEIGYTAELYALLESSFAAVYGKGVI